MSKRNRRNRAIPTRQPVPLPRELARRAAYRLADHADSLAVAVLTLLLSRR